MKVVVLKVILIFMFILFLGMTIFISTKRMIDITLLIFFMFLFFTLIFYVFKATKEDKIIINTVWKVYFPSIVLILTIHFSVLSFLLSLSFNQLELQINNVDNKKSQNLVQEYIKTTEIFLSTFKREKVEDNINIYLLNKSKSNNINLNDTLKNDEVEYVNWFSSLMFNLINLLSIFLILKCVTDLSFFQNIRNGDFNDK